MTDDGEDSDGGTGRRNIDALKKLVAFAEKIGVHPYQTCEEDTATIENIGKELEEIMKQDEVSGD